MRNPGRVGGKPAHWEVLSNSRREAASASCRKEEGREKSLRSLHYFPLGWMTSPAWKQARPEPRGRKGAAAGACISYVASRSRSRLLS